MQYFSLLIPIIIGYIANDIWSGVVVGSILWLAAGQAGSVSKRDETIRTKRKSGSKHCKAKSTG